jgi:serine/threonine-protein kinase
MALTPGTRLHAYEIVGPIGAGGMGEVYRARDTKLNRDVAIKVLLPAVANDPDRLARFSREAQVLASINHPNIAHIHGLEEADGVTALILELVEGEDLAQRIARGPIPLDEALRIARQIADGLEAAHDQGIIHRDLKPANIKVRPDGTVKVLDFGLAKAMEPAAGSSSSMSMSPTLTTPAMMTGVGMILGTAAYMSPEQAKGRAVDKRSDIWAFGAVLFEMLTGKRAFDGDDVQDTFVAIMRDEPDWARLPAALPFALGTYLKRCLQKDAQQRVQAMGDVRLALAGAFETAGPQSATSGARPMSATVRMLPWAVAATFAVAAIALVILSPPWRAETSLDRPFVRLDVDLGPMVSLPPPSVDGSSVILSSDGTRLAYVSGASTKLFTRRLDQPTATELPGTAGATGPFFSPDGQWIGFGAANKLNKISVDGGAIVPLGALRNMNGATWGDDGNIIVAEPFSRGTVRIPANGGPAEILTPLANGEVTLAFPQLLPGGKAVLFSAVATPGAENGTIEVLTLADRHRKVVVRGGFSARYLATSSGNGHLVYTNKATLFAVPFDLNTLETRGTAVPILDDVAYSAGTNGAAQLTFSSAPSGHGTLVYRRAGATVSAPTTIQWVDATGKKEPLRSKSSLYQYPSVSPDGKRLALTDNAGGGFDVWVYEPLRDAMTRLTFGGGGNRFPVWSPDGQYIVFERIGNGLFWTRTDGASQPQALTTGKDLYVPWSFSPDGKRLAYVNFEGSPQVWTVPLEEQNGQLKSGKPEQFLKSGFSDLAPAFSPDGRWLAYQSNESGKNEVYVRAFPHAASRQGGKWQVSNDGGVAPRWSRNGHELMYRSGDQIIAASYTAKGDTFVAEKPRVWIAKLGGTEWDLAPDGKRVAVLTPVESGEAPKQDHEVVFLQNFFDELRRRVPLGK